MKFSLKLEKSPGTPLEQFNEIMSEVKTGLRKIGQRGVEKRVLYTSSWKNTGRNVLNNGLTGKSKPDFTFEITQDGQGEFTINVYSVSEEAEGARVSVWHLLKYGTDEKLVAIPEDYIRSTVEHSAIAGPRGGTTPYKFANEANPGIIKRDMDKYMNEEEEGPVEGLIDASFKRGFRKAEQRFS